MDIEMEKENQINEGDEMNLEMDDDEINHDQESDDDSDEISNWTSLNVGSGNDTNAVNSPEFTNFDDEFGSSNNMFQQSNDNPKVMQIYEIVWWIP